MILKQHYYKEKTFLISSVVIIKACVSSKKEREKILPKHYLQYEQVDKHSTFWTKNKDEWMNEWMFVGAVNYCLIL